MTSSFSSWSYILPEILQSAIGSQDIAKMATKYTNLGKSSQFSKIFEGMSLRPDEMGFDDMLIILALMDGGAALFG